MTLVEIYRHSLFNAIKSYVLCGFSVGLPADKFVSLLTFWYTHVSGSTTRLIVDRNDLLERLQAQ